MLRVQSKIWRQKKNPRVAPRIRSPWSNDNSIGDTNSSKLTLQGSCTHFLDQVSGSSEDRIKSVSGGISELSRLNIKRKKDLSSRSIICPANIRSRISNSSRSKEGKSSVRSASYEDHSSRSSSVSNPVESTSLSIKKEQLERKTQGRLIIVQPCRSLTPSSYDSLGSENLLNWIYPRKVCSFSDSNSFRSWSVSLGELDDYSEEESAPVHPYYP